MAEVLDLGLQPQASVFPSLDELALPEPRWPLRALVCRACWLIQLDAAAADEPGTSRRRGEPSSSTMRAAATAAVDDLIARLQLDARTRIYEVASHGGYLQSFFEARGLATQTLAPGDLLGSTVPPASADVLVDSYLLAHLPDPKAGLAAYAALLAPDGWLVLEFDHAMSTIAGRQFDAFRHGHYTYLTLTWLAAALQTVGFAVDDAIELPAYGGALRILARRRQRTVPEPSTVAAIRAREEASGLATEAAYVGFARDASAACSELLDHLTNAGAAGRLVAGYGAPSRASTLLNAAGVTSSLLPFTADASPDKWGRFVPGVGIPIVRPAELTAARPDEILILVWDLQAEVVRQLQQARDWHARFLVPIPRLTEVASA